MKLNKKHFIGFIILALVILVTVYLLSFDREIFDKNLHSTSFYDRNGNLLKTEFSGDERYFESSALSDISPHFLRAVVLIEDKHFYSHHGVYLPSLFRAFHQNLKAKRVVSGGSTITMQLVKLTLDHKDRSLKNKISEIAFAFKLDLYISKSEILEEYINRLPFGNLIYGIKQASKFYFNKPPSELSLNQAIYLALIPKSPTKYNPKKHQKKLKKRWAKILEVFRERKYISEDEYLRAKKEGIEFYMEQYPFQAPHFIEMVKVKFNEGSGRPLPEKIITTLDLELQNDIEGIISAHLVRLKRYNVNSAACVVIDNHTHEVIVLVGSHNYFDKEFSGQVNMATSLRQPGSTLKPFVYGLALENGYSPGTIVPDIRFPAKGGFFPENHDGKHHGPLRIREALASSYNIPAFYMAMKLTPKRIIKKLRKAGFSYIKDDPGFYGETIALGSGEVKLIDLVTAYSCFANNGMVYFPKLTKDGPIKKVKLFDEKAAFIIWDILADRTARFPSFGYNSSMNLPFPLAVKTGTSKGFRDKWAIAVNTEFTVGVWLGNPDGKNMKDISRVGNAPTIMRDVFLAIQKDWSKGQPKTPEGLVKRMICPVSGELITNNCPDSFEEFFMENNIPIKKCSSHIKKGGKVITKYPEEYRDWAKKNKLTTEIKVEIKTKKFISFPQNGDYFYISDAISMQSQKIPFEVMGFQNSEVVSFILDGNLYRKTIIHDTVFWELKPGTHLLSIQQNGKTIDEIRFYVK